MKYLFSPITLVVSTVLAFIIYLYAGSIPPAVHEEIKDVVSVKAKTAPAPVATPSTDAAPSAPVEDHAKLTADERLQQVIDATERLDEEELKELMQASQEEIDGRKLIELANAGRLSYEEREELSQLMTQVSVAKLALLNKQLDQLAVERERHAQ